MATADDDDGPTSSGKRNRPYPKSRVAATDNYNVRNWIEAAKRADDP